MFTGLIKGIGVVMEKTNTSSAATLKIETILASELNLGDSVAVNGVCLTASALGPNWFRADMMPETIKSSNLNFLKSSDKVNLEPALAFGERLGGHLVSGHVDCISRVSAVYSEQNFRIIKVSFPAEMAKFIALKGSVAVNGVSLTIQGVSGNEFMISLIPHTLQETNLQFIKVNDLVNIEVDLLARYVVNIMEQQSGKTGLTESFLRENGF